MLKCHKYRCADGAANLKIQRAQCITAVYTNGLDNAVVYYGTEDPLNAAINATMASWHATLLISSLEASKRYV